MQGKELVGLRLALDQGCHVLAYRRSHLEAVPRTPANEPGIFELWVAIDQEMAVG
jgi:hypothetical protein